MKLVNLKQLYSGQELKDYCEEHNVFGLEETDYEDIISEAHKVNQALFIDTNRRDFMIALKCIDEDSNISVCIEPQKLYYMYKSLSEVIESLLEYKRESLQGTFKPDCEDATDLASYWNKCQQAIDDYRTLRSMQSDVETYGKNVSYMVDTVCSANAFNHTPINVACPDRATGYRRVSYLIGQFLYRHNGSSIDALCYLGEDEELFNLNNLAELRDLALYLDTFGRIELTSKDNKTGIWHNAVFIVSEPKPDVITVAFNLIEYNGDEFPEVESKVWKFNSYDKAKDEYDRLTRPYIDKYGPESDYRFKNNEYYNESEKEWTNCAYATDHLLELKISNRDTKFHLKCSVISH